MLLILPERGGISGGVGSGGIHTALSRQLFDEWDARARSGGESGGFLGDAGLRGEIQLNMNIPYTVS